MIFAQKSANDSLETLLSKANSDTAKLTLLKNLYNNSLINPDFNKSISYAKTGIKLSKKINDNKSLAEWQYNYAYANHYFSKLDIALEYYIKSLKTSEEIDDKKSQAKCLAGIGIINSNMGQRESAFKKYSEALTLYEELKDTNGVIAMQNNIAGYYYMKNEKRKAIEHFKIALETTGKNKKFEIYQSTLLSNLASIYCEIGEHEQAFKYYSESATFIEASNDNYSISMLYTDWGSCLYQSGKTDKALEYILKAYEIANTFKLYDRIESSAGWLSEIYEKKGDLKTALKYTRVFIETRDSILNREKSKQISELNTKYETEKKQNEIELLNKEKEKQEILTTEQNKQKNTIIISILIGLSLVVVFALFMFKKWRLTQRQKKVIEQSKAIIEEKNKDITDSINYAKRIQNAKFSQKSDLQLTFKDSFILFKPKDIVSGDFYFFSNRDQSFFIAAADCTGHGVPGAFMSLIGIEKLDECVKQSNKVSEILQNLNKAIKTSLKQNDHDTSSRDGMDIALCSIDLTNHSLNYAGANRPLWLIRKDSLNVEEIKATKKAIGGLTDNDQFFQTHECKLNKGDTFYIFSDGFADQFSGTDGKKLMTKNFKEILSQIQNLSLSEQEQYLDEYLEKWKSGTEQVDDILVIGIRI